MKSRILRSVLLVAYIGFALSGQLGSLQSNAASANAIQNAHTGLSQINK